MPFALLDSTVITLSSSVERVINVGDGLKGSVGRYRLDTRFEAAQFPPGVLTVPRTLDLSVTIGAEGYPGGAVLSPSDLRIDGDKWKEEKK